MSAFQKISPCQKSFPEVCQFDKKESKRREKEITGKVLNAYV